MDTLVTIAGQFWGILCEMAPYLLFGFLMAGILSVLIPPETVEKHLGGQGIWPVIKASLFGVPLPLCSCGVIPVAASLRRHGSSKGATTAFLLSTPQTGVDSIMVTLSLLGPVFAVFRPMAAFIVGVLGGAAVEKFGGTEESEVKPGSCTDECCAPTHRQSVLARAFRYGFIVLPRDITKPLLIGLLVAGVISVFVPRNFFSETLGTGIFAMLVMMALGIPLYVCATASVPVAAAMIAKGVTPGAALVFLMTGPATNAATIATIWKVLGKRTAVIYLGVVAITALASGLILDYVFTFGSFTSGRIEHQMIPDHVKTLSAILLLALLGMALFRPHGKGGS